MALIITVPAAPSRMKSTKSRQIVVKRPAGRYACASLQADLKCELLSGAALSNLLIFVGFCSI